MKVMEQGRMTREEIEQKIIRNSKGAARAGFGKKRTRGNRQKRPTVLFS